MPEFYRDEPQYYGKVELNGKVIRLRSTPESDAFLDSVVQMENPDELLGLTAWLAQKAVTLMEYPEAIDRPCVPIPLGKRMVKPRPTSEGQQFIASVSRIADRDRLKAIGCFLKELTLQLLIDKVPAVAKEMVENRK